MKYLTSTLACTLLLLPGLISSADGHGFGRAGGSRAGGAVGPAGGYRGGVAARGAVGPYGAAAGGVRHGTVVTPRGTTVRAGQVGGVRVGPAGVRAGGVSGARVTTPAGRTVTTGRAGGVAAGPRGVAVGGVGGRAAVGPYGAVAGATRVGVGPRGAVVGHSTYRYSPTAFYRQAGVVRRGYYPYFNRSWYGRHPVAWRPYRWAAANYWLAPTWTTVVPYVGLGANVVPYSYDYGGTVVYNDDNVYSDGVLLATAEAYADKAATLAAAGYSAVPGEQDVFQPLGVFGVIYKDQETPQHIFQLGVDKSGVVRGNYYDVLTDQTTPVYGSVDPRSQRVAWSVGDKKRDIIFEAGLYNLTQPQCTALVHYGNTKTVQIGLVHLEEPTDGTR